MNIHFGKRNLLPFLLAVAVAMVALSPLRAQHTPPIRTLTEQEVVDLMVGGSIQGTRSSNTDQMVNGAKAILASGGKFNIISIDDVPDDWTIVAAAGGIGGGTPWQYVVDRTKGQTLPTVSNSTVLAFNALSAHVGKKFNAIIRNEAAGATLNVFQVSNAVGVPVVDTCPTGRAKPEVDEWLPFINGFSSSPAALATKWGDVIFFDKTVDDFRYEDMARAIAVASGGGVSNVKLVISGRDLKRTTIHGALSQAILFGRTVREATAQGKDPIAALLKVSDAHEMFRGTVSKQDGNGERGFAWWNVEITGKGAYAGHTYKVFVKNEDMDSWLDGKPDVMSPDLIYPLDPKTGQAITGGGLGAYTVGSEVVILARPAPSPAWRSAKGIEVIGPRHFGFDFDYVPLEQTLKTRPKFASN
jgi:DUF917 family protein